MALKDIIHLMQKERYDDALRAIEILFDNNEKLPTQQVTKLCLLKAEALIKKGEYTKAKQHLEYLETVQLPLEEEIKLLELKGDFHWYNENYEESLQALKKALTIIQEENLEQKYLKNLGNIHNRIGTVYFEKSEIMVALKHFKKSLEYREALGDPKQIAHSYNNLGAIYEFKGDYVKALQYYKKALQLKEKHSTKRDAALSKHNIGLVHYFKGEYEKALKFYEEALQILKQNGTQKEIALTLNSLGNVHAKQGNLDKALQYYEEAIKIRKQLNHKKELADTLNNMGSVYHEKGELDKALQYFKQTMRYYEEVGSEVDISYCYHNIARINFEKGYYSKAREFLEKALEIRRKIKNQVLLAETLFDLILVELRSNNKEGARLALTELEKLRGKKSELVSLYKKLAKGLLLKTRPRLKERAKAQKIFEEIIAQPMLDYRCTIIAIVNEMDLVFQEAELYSYNEFLQEFNQLIEKLQQISETQNIHYLKAEILFFKGKTQFLQGNIQKAFHTMEQAIKLAEQKGLIRLALHLTREYEKILGKYETVKKATQTQQKSLNQDFLEVLKIEDHLQRFITPYYLEASMEKEQPILLMIITDGGIPLYSYHFQHQTPLKDNLIASFLIAMHQFSKETFQQGGDLKQITLKEYKIVFMSFDTRIFAYVYQGNSLMAMKTLETFIETISSNQRFWKEFIGIIPVITKEQSSFLDEAITRICSSGEEQELETHSDQGISLDK